MSPLYKRAGRILYAIPLTSFAALLWLAVHFAQPEAPSTAAPRSKPPISMLRRGIEKTIYSAEGIAKIASPYSELCMTPDGLVETLYDITGHTEHGHERRDFQAPSGQFKYKQALFSAEEFTFQTKQAGSSDFNGCAAHAELLFGGTYPIFRAKTLKARGETSHAIPRG